MFRLRVIDYQNIAAFFVCSLSLISCIFYKFKTFGETGNILPAVGYSVGIFSFVDLFFVKSIDHQLHHITCLGIVFYKYYYGVDPVDGDHLLYYMLQMELSTFCLILKYYLDKNSLAYNINNIVFYGLFTKFRIIDVYYGIMHKDSYLYLIVSKYTPDNIVGTSIILSSCYFLYALNLYWYMIINKQLYKSMFTNIKYNAEKYCQYLCSYTYFINIPICLTAYSGNYRRHIYDIIGIGILSITSHLYHNDIYTKYQTDKITRYEYPENNYLLFIGDTASIHIRAFLATYSNYYVNTHWRVPVAISGIFHAMALSYILVHLFNLKYDSTYDKEHFFKMIYMLCLFPQFIDMVFIHVNSTNEYGIEFAIVNTMIACLFIVEPFHRLNHFAFHILIMYNTYYLCLMNSTSPK